MTSVRDAVRTLRSVRQFKPDPLPDDVLRVILNAVDYDGRSPDVDFVPDRHIVLSGAQELQRMDAERIRKGRFTV